MDLSFQRRFQGRQVMFLASIAEEGQDGVSVYGVDVGTGQTFAQTVVMERDWAQTGFKALPTLTKPQQQWLLELIRDALEISAPGQLRVSLDKGHPRAPRQLAPIQSLVSCCPASGRVKWLECERALRRDELRLK